MKVVIGTRGSKLALWQAYFIAEQLKAAGVEPEILKIETKGDKILDRTLSKIGSKGIFTEELENALRSGEIDIAVHSAKDLQSSLDADLEIIAFTEREQVHDVLVSKKNIDIDKPLLIGTSSTRRVALLKHYYPHFQITDLRGNLQTRMQKHETGVCDAMMLAFAGVHRMKMSDDIAFHFPIEKITPPVGQGSMAIEICKDKIDSGKKELIRKVCNDTSTEYCLLAERSYLKTMNGGCSIPVFGHATLTDNQLTLNAGIISLDGSEKINFTLTEDLNHATELGKKMAEIVLSSGGNKILESIKRNL